MKQYGHRAAVLGTALRPAKPIVAHCAAAYPGPATGVPTIEFSGFHENAIGTNGTLSARYRHSRPAPGAAGKAVARQGVGGYRPTYWH
jgi:hypothetical protein